MVQPLEPRDYLCDTNVWFALVVGSHDHHDVIQTWLDSLERDRFALFCRSTQQSLLRLLTTAGTMALYSLPPFTNREAWQAYEAVLADERIAYAPAEPEGLDSYWHQFSSRTTSSPKLWMDAYLAAFARAGGYQMVTTDAAFRQFEDLDVVVLSPAG